MNVLEGAEPRASDLVCVAARRKGVLGRLQRSVLRADQIPTMSPPLFASPKLH